VERTRIFKILRLYDIYGEIKAYGENQSERFALNTGLKNGTGVIYYDITCNAAGRTFHYSGVNEWGNYPFVD
jgi:hypothetical protein